MARKKVSAEFETVDAGSATFDTFDQTHESEPDAPTGYQRFGPSESPYAHGALMRGGTMYGAMIPLVTGGANETFTNTTWSKIDTAEVAYGTLPCPPGMVAIVRLNVNLKNDTAGEQTSFRLNTVYRDANGFGPITQLDTEASNTDIERFMEDKYVNEWAYVQSTQDGSENDYSNRATFLLERKVTGGTGTLYQDATLGILYEVF